MARDTSDLLHGTLDLLVLKALSTTPMHGYGATCEAAMQAFASSWHRE